MWWKLRPTILVSLALSALVKAVTPYTSIYFSAQIIGELSQGRDPQVLAQWIGMLLGTQLDYFCSMEPFLGGRVWEQEQTRVENEKFYMDKMMELDYSIMQNQQVCDLYSQIRQNENWAGWGLLQMLNNYELVFTNVFQIVAGLILSLGLLVQKVPEGSGWEFLNHPVWVIVVFAVMLSVALLSLFSEIGV